MQMWKAFTELVFEKKPTALTLMQSLEMRQLSQVRVSQDTEITTSTFIDAAAIDNKTRTKTPKSYFV